MKKDGLYIVFEGPDGSGKSQQAKKIVDKLNQMQIDTVGYREPGGEIGKRNTIGEKIRKILKDNNNVMNPLCELALFTANRAQIIDEIKEYNKKGINVICERNYLSSIVYQGYGRGLDINFIINVTDMFVDKKPDIVVIYDVDTKTSIDRVSNRGSKDRFENEGVEFHNKIANGYKKLKDICNMQNIEYITINTTSKQWEEYEKIVINKIQEYF